MEDIGPDNKQICVFDYCAKRWSSDNYGIFIETVPYIMSPKGLHNDTKCYKQWQHWVSKSQKQSASTDIYSYELNSFKDPSFCIFDESGGYVGRQKLKLYNRNPCDNIDPRRREKQYMS